MFSLWTYKHLDNGTKNSTCFLLLLVFQQSKNDYSLFTKTEGSYFIVALVYVDNVLSTNNSLQLIMSTMDALHSKFTIKTWGELNTSLVLNCIQVQMVFFLIRRSTFLILLIMLVLTMLLQLKFLFPHASSSPQILELFYLQLIYIEELLTYNYIFLSPGLALFILFNILANLFRLQNHLLSMLLFIS